MTRLHKFNLKNICFTCFITAFCIVITWNSEARRANYSEIYSTLTSDTTPAPKKKPSRSGLTDSRTIKKDTTIRDTSLRKTTIRDTTIRDTSRRDTSIKNAVDTFSLKFSKDTLDAPVAYEAADSGVLMVKEKKFYLYGKTQTTYKDVVLTAPTVQLDQQTNIMKAINSRDSAGNVLNRAQFKQGTEGFQSDTIEYNFKTQKGLTRNTYTKQQEMFVQAEYFKKINPNTTFAKRVIMTTCDYDDPHFGFVGNKGKFINNKVAVTGPVHPEFEGVPIPIYLPFGIFPLQQGRHSGMLPPQFTVTQQYGLGLEGLGYYHVLNEYFDVTMRGNIYSYGGWTANVIPSYRKRYRYNGSLSLSVQHTKINFKGDPDYSASNTYFITWNHTMDQRAHPGMNFSANVNAGSTTYNKYVTNNPYRNFQNQLSSSIAYSKTWAGKPFNLTLSANHNQNNESHQINLILPDAGFTVTTLYPFQKKDFVGTPKWYEKIGVGYSGVARNMVSFIDTNKNSFNHLLDTMQWGAQHRFPISMSLPPVGSFIFSPFVSYEETWLTNRMFRQWNDTANKIDTISSKKGLFIDRQVSFGMGVNTAIYGTYEFKNSRIIAIRHVMRPTISFNYRPDLSRKYYDIIPVGAQGNKQVFSQLSNGRNIFSGYSYGQFGGITFGIDNNLEMKVKKKKDTTGGKETTKIKLIDGFGFTSGYNFLSDSLKLQPFNLYLRSTLFGKLNLTAQALYDPYQRNEFGNDINRFVWQGDRFTFGRLRSGSISMSTQFQSKPRDPNKSATQTPVRQITDPALLQDEQRLQDYMRRNPAEFVDFNLPWSLSLSYSLFFNDTRQEDSSYKIKVNSNVSFNNSFSLTPKWNFTTSGYFDFNTMKITMFTMSISRDMHCWQMSINVVPVGIQQSFNISISPKSSILQDLKVNRTRTFMNY